LFAVNPNGNSWNPNDAQVYNSYVLSDSNHKFTNGANTTEVMPYMLRIDNTGSIVVNGGIKIRMFYPLVQKNTIDSYPDTSWFTFLGTKNDLLAATSSTGIANVRDINGSSYGIISGVNYVQFDNVTETLTYGFYGKNGICTKEGTTGVGLASIVGISTLNRSGTNWLNSFKNGYLVLESKTKGFVIPRMAEPESSIANPIEGMIVFDTNDQCIKLYNGINWVSTIPSCD
jgi:hypothetical protein